MNDMTPVIQPKSDQLNADSLQSGPITITVASVSIRPGTEQPISIHYEGDNGKPYKPCKSMARVLVAMWDADASKYAGRSMTLYCDPTVKWAGMEVGGIRISHMSHIDREHTMALTASKGNRKPFKIQPLAMPRNEKIDIVALTVQGRTAAMLGETKAERQASLKAFWTELPVSAQKVMKPILDGELKPIADSGNLPDASTADHF